MLLFVDESRLQKGFDYYYEYSMLNDSLRGERTSNEVRDLQVKYETEKKEMKLQN